MKSPETHECESLNIAVPRRLFRNNKTWLFWEAGNSSLLWFFVIVAALGTCSLYIIDPKFLFPVELVSSVSLYIAMMYILWRPHSARRVISKNKAQLAKVIYEVDPGLDSKKWDEVTYRMNDLLYQNSLWSTPYCLFDRDACQDAFRICLLKPFLEENTTDNESDATGNEKDCSEACVAYYQRALIHEFEYQLSNPLPGLLWTYETLPRDFHRKRFTSALKSLPKRQCLILLGLHVCLLLTQCDFDGSTMDQIKILAMSVWLLVCVFKSIFDNQFVKYEKLSLQERLRFLATVIKVKANSNAERLDIVARYMNQYLRSDEVWKDPQEYFFDGKECLSFFQKQLAPLASNKKLKGNVTTYYELKDMVSETLESLKSSE